MKRITIILPLVVFLLTHCRSKTDTEKFEFSCVKSDINGHFDKAYYFSNLIIGQFFDSAFFVLDTNYNHVVKIEKVLNDLPKVNSIGFYKNDMLLVLENKTIAVFDSNFHRKHDIETKLNNNNRAFFYYDDDSFYIYNSKNIYSITGNYDINILDSVTFIQNHKLASFGKPKYIDSIYNVYSCCAGEFGGNIFFKNKKSKTTYSLPCYFHELIYFDSTYNLIESFGSVSQFVKIKDPSKLYVTDINTDPYICCNCDSGYQEYFYGMAQEKRNLWLQDREVNIYFDSNRIQTLSSFIWEDNLYSLVLTDSLFWILKHANSIEFIQSFPRQDLRIREYSYVNKVTTTTGKQLISLSGTYWSTNGLTNTKHQVDRMGFIIIDKNKIDIYESYSEKEINQ